MTLKEFLEKVNSDIKGYYTQVNELVKQYDRQMKHAHKSKQEKDIEKAHNTFTEKVKINDKALEINNAMRVLSKHGYFEGLDD